MFVLVIFLLYILNALCQPFIKSSLGLFRFSTRDFTTKWINVDRRVITGCTISVIGFVLGMNLVLMAAEEETRGTKTESRIRMPSSRDFMDDITVTHSLINRQDGLCCR